MKGFLVAEAAADNQSTNKIRTGSRRSCFTVSVLCFRIVSAVAASRTNALIKAFIVAVVASISIPLFGSLFFSLLVAPILWFYGFVVAILVFPIAFLSTLAASVWLGVQTYLKGWFSLKEAVIAVVISATATSLILNSDRVLGVNTLPTIAGEGRWISLLVFLLIGLAFASVGAVATQLLLAKMSLIRDPRSEVTADGN